MWDRFHWYSETSFALHKRGYVGQLGWAVEFPIYPGSTVAFVMLHLPPAELSKVQYRITTTKVNRKIFILDGASKLCDEELEKVFRDRNVGLNTINGHF